MWHMEKIGRRFTILGLTGPLLEMEELELIGNYSGKGEISIKLGWEESRQNQNQNQLGIIAKNKD